MAALKIALSFLSYSSSIGSLKSLVLCHGRPFSQALSFFSFHRPLIPAPPPFRLCIAGAARSLSSSSNTNTNSPASFDRSDDDEHEEKKVSELPPPYDPFNKKASVVEEAGDPSDLQAVFHEMRSEGLTNSAIKMFDALSKDGLTHEALELFSIIKDKGSMPDVVAHTAVIEAYASAGGHSKHAIRTLDRMLASGVSPNAYTYTVLIKGLARDGKLPEARRFLLEMMEKGMRPNAGTYVAVFEAYTREQRIQDARSLLEEMRSKGGFNPDEKAVREQLGKRGQVFGVHIEHLLSYLGKCDPNGNNSWVWYPQSHCQGLSVKVYHYLNSPKDWQESWKGWKDIWALKTAPRVKHFVWLLMQGKIKTSEYLYSLNLALVTIVLYVDLI